VLIERSVGSVRVVVRDVLLQHYREVAWSGDQEVVEAFAAQGADPALCDGVGSRCSDTVEGGCARSAAATDPSVSK
jgi:hypothetical protein